MAGVKTKSQSATRHNPPRAGRRVAVRTCGVCSQAIAKAADGTTILSLNYATGSRISSRVPAHRKCVGATK